ncbi:MAG: hypothetical protein Q8O46_04100 [bacterium]|nr:hypothetical protein [bacterium]
MINSADIALDYDEDLLSFSGYKNEGSMMRLWIDSPHEENGKILMSGIIPGGVSGLYDPKKQGLGKIPLTRLIFTPRQEGRATFSFMKTKILKHNGKGTELLHEDRGGEIVITGRAVEGEGNQEIIDKTKPNPFEITFLESAFWGRTPSMIIFNTNDVDSGVKEYSVNTGGKYWAEAKSPYPISKSLFSRNIAVRAFDFNGNFQEANIGIPGLFNLKFLWVVFIFLIFCFSVYKVLKYKA